MMLSFDTHHRGERTWFAEKIMLAFKEEPITMHHAAFFKSAYSISGDISELNPKLHTLRKGKKWKEGQDIEYYVTRHPLKPLQFMPVKPCLKVEEVDIMYRKTGPRDSIAEVFINRNLLGSIIWSGTIVMSVNIELVLLAKNDGFENVEAFFNYFNEDFSGQLIHWTNEVDYLNMKEVGYE